MPYETARIAKMLRIKKLDIFITKQFGLLFFGTFFICQFVLMMLASSICSAISTHELAAAAAFVESQTYRSFEVYIVVTLIYLALALSLRLILALVGMWLFGRRVARKTMTALPEVQS